MIDLAMTVEPPSELIMTAPVPSRETGDKRLHYNKGVFDKHPHYSKRHAYTIATEHTIWFASYPIFDGLQICKTDKVVFVPDPYNQNLSKVRGGQSYRYRQQNWLLRAYKIKKANQDRLRSTFNPIVVVKNGVKSVKKKMNESDTEGEGNKTGRKEASATTLNNVDIDHILQEKYVYLQMDITQCVRSANATQHKLRQFIDDLPIETSKVTWYRLWQLVTWILKEWHSFDKEIKVLEKEEVDESRCDGESRVPQ